MPITSGFNHIATMSTDLDRTVAWYADAFDAEKQFEMVADGDHPRMAIVGLGGGAALNIFEVEPKSIVGDRGRIGGRGAIDHFGIAVDSLETLEQVRDRLHSLGAEVGEIRKLGGEWSLFFRDIEGMELEVCAPAAGQGH